LFSTHFRELSALNSLIVNQSRDILTTHKDRLSSIREKTLQHTQQMLFEWKGELLGVSSLISVRPLSVLTNRQAELKNLIGNLRTFHAQYMKNQRGYLSHLQTVIRLMHPMNILRKGFALVKVNGKVISDPEDISPGQHMEVILADAQINATVDTKTRYDGNEFNL
jgi:exodeoxyribonuclease VII large subunit